MTSDRAPESPAPSLSAPATSISFTQSMMHRFASIGALLVTIAGLALFAYTIQRAGVHDTIDKLRQMGVAGFLLILLLSGTRLLVRSMAWVWCMEGEPRLSLRAAFEASLIGEALGNITPFGTFISEPSKAIVVRSQVPLHAALSGIAVENIFYALTVNIVIALGSLGFLLNFQLTDGLRKSSIAVLAGVAVFVGVSLLVILSRATPLSTVLAWVLRGWRQHDWQRHWVERVQTIESRIYSFYGRHRQKLPALLAFETIFHLCGVAEVYVTLSYVSGGQMTFLDALILESVGRLINVLFKFVPLRLGVDEYGAAQVSRVLGLDPTAGVTLALVRKARILAWTAVGIFLLARRGLSIRTVLHDAETVSEKG
jgi:hypothetical protein